jgi:predicted Zn-dependent peptidase
MYAARWRRKAGHIFLLIIMAAAVPAATAESSRDLPETVRGAGGAELILDHYPGSGSVLVAVAVRAGSAWEAPETRGVTHLLEHLLFDGSERFTREEISGWVDDNGAFLNAFTRKEVTVYFLLVRSDLLEESIEILSQMLLHPVFSTAEIEKERKVVLEEMSQGLDDPREAVSRAADRYLYRGSSLTEPVIGYQSTIESVSRDRIISYYRSRYTPGKMRIFVTGDFDRDRALGWIEDHFTAAGGSEDEGTRPEEKPLLMPRWSGEITTRVIADSENRIDLLFRMPAAGDKLFPAALLLAEILASPSSPLKEVAKGSGLPEPSAGLEVHEEFAALRISIDSEEGSGVDPEALLEAVTSLAGWSPDEKELETAKTSFASSDMFDSERYHFYVMLNGEAMAVAGAGWQKAVAAVEKVKRGEISKMVGRYLGEPEFNGFFVTPNAPDVRMERGETSFETLAGGLVAGARQREGSPVEALSLLFPGRACVLPVDLWGWGGSAIHIALENSSGGRSLKEDLASMGARIQWGDNPYIPMDDYLVNPGWSFIRLETPAGRMREAAGLLAGFLEDYIVDSDDIRAAAAAVAREHSMRAEQSSAVLKNTVYKGLFRSHPFGLPLFPSPEDLAGIDSMMVRAARKSLHRNTGCVVTLVSPRVREESLDLLRAVFGRYSTSGMTGCPAIYPGESGGTVEGVSPGSGALLAAAWCLHGLSDREAAALAVAAEALSRRMQLDIRETRGLAYSTGCSMTQVAGHLVVTASLGTRGENAGEAETALREDIEGLVADPITSMEAAAARSRLVSRLSRRELSSTGEALGIALDHLYRDGRDGLELIAAVPSGEVLEMAGRLGWETALFVRLLPSGEAPEKKSMPPGMMRR